MSLRSQTRTKDDDEYPRKAGLFWVRHERFSGPKPSKTEDIPSSSSISEFQPVFMGRTRTMVQPTTRGRTCIVFEDPLRHGCIAALGNTTAWKGSNSRNGAPRGKARRFVYLPGGT